MVVRTKAGEVKQQVWQTQPGPRYTGLFFAIDPSSDTNRDGVYGSDETVYFWVAMKYHRCIAKYDENGNLIEMLGGLGETLDVNLRNDYDFPYPMLFAPNEIVVDDAGRVFVTDCYDVGSGYWRLIMYDPFYKKWTEIFPPPPASGEENHYNGYWVYFVGGLAIDHDSDNDGPEPDGGYTAPADPDEAAWVSTLKQYASDDVLYFIARVYTGGNWYYARFRYKFDTSDSDPANWEWVLDDGWTTNPVYDTTTQNYMPVRARIVQIDTASPPTKRWLVQTTSDTYRRFFEFSLADGNLVGTSYTRTNEYYHWGFDQVIFGSNIYLYFARSAGESYSFQSFHEIDVYSQAAGSDWPCDGSTISTSSYLNAFGSFSRQFNLPTDIWIMQRDTGYEMWVMEFGNHRVQRIQLDSSDGSIGDSVGIINLASSEADWGLFRPEGVAYHPEGYVLVADTFHNRIAVYDRNGNFVASIGKPGLSGAGYFNYPRGIFVDDDGKVWITQEVPGGTDKVICMDLDKAMSNPFDPTAYTATDLSGFSSPTGIYVTPSYVYVLDYQYNWGKAYVFKRESGVLIYESFFTPAGPNDSSQGFRYAWGIVKSSDGTLWVAADHVYISGVGWDPNGSDRNIQFYIDGNPTGTRIYTSSDPKGLCGSPDDTSLYVVTSGSDYIYHFDSGGVIDKYPASRMYYGRNYIYNFVDARGLAVNSFGEVYVTSCGWLYCSTLSKFLVSSIKTTSIIVDGTPPEASITSPKDNEVVTERVVIEGTATDTHFKRYSLWYGIGYSPSIWFPIADSVETPVSNGKLGEWNVTHLPTGAYTIKLEAYDVLGHKTSVEVNVKVVSVGATGLVTSIRAYPSPTNPAEHPIKIVYNLSKFSHVTLSIYTLNWEKVATLFNGVQLIGTYIIEWDGKDEEDQMVNNGVYFYRLEVKSGDEKEVKVGKIAVLR